VKNYLVTKMGRLKKYLKKHLQTNTLIHLHTQYLVPRTWLGVHQGIQFAPMNSLYELHMARYQDIMTLAITVIGV